MNTHIHSELITYNLLSVPHGSQKHGNKKTPSTIIYDVH